MKIVLILAVLACCLAFLIVVSDSADNVVFETTQRPIEQNETVPETSFPIKRVPIPHESEVNISVQGKKEVTKNPQPKEMKFGWDVIDQYFVSKILEGMERPVVNGAEFVKKLQNGEKPKIPDWAILSFGEGVFDLTRTFSNGSFQKLSSDILFEGAGIDKTLLIVGKGIYCNGDKKFEWMTFRDLTLDAANDGLFDICTFDSKESVRLDFDRVRVVRFDSGCAGSCLFCLNTDSTSIIRARDSEFVCGYGRGRKPGTLSREGNFLAYFFNCTFELVDFKLRKIDGYQIRFDQCKFVNVREDETFTENTDPSKTENLAVIFNCCELDGMLRRGESMSKHRKDFDEFLSRFNNTD